MNCDTVDSGCNGELTDNAFASAEENAVCTETVYSYTATKGACMVSSPTTGITQGSVTGYKDVFTDSAGFDVDSDAATYPHRQLERPVLVSIVLVWCVDRFTRREDAVAYGNPYVSMATASLKRTSRSRESVGQHTQKCSHSSLLCTVVAFSLVRCVHLQLTIITVVSGSSRIENCAQPSACHPCTSAYTTTDTSTSDMAKNLTACRRTCGCCGKEVARTLPCWIFMEKGSSRRF